MWRTLTMLISMLLLAMPVSAQYERHAELTNRSVSTLEFGIVKLFDVTMPVTLHFSFDPIDTAFPAGLLARPERVSKPRDARTDTLVTTYSGRIFNARGDADSTIIWQDRSPEWMASFAPIVFPAPEDGSIYMELTVTVRWADNAVCSPDCGRYTASLNVICSNEPDAVGAWADLYPRGFVRGVPVILAEDEEGLAAVKAATIARARSLQGTPPPDRRTPGFISREERMERLAAIRARAKSNR